MINPLFIEEGELYDSEDRIVATFTEISSPEQLEQLQPKDEQPDNVIIDLLDWQVGHRFLPQRIDVEVT